MKVGPSKVGKELSGQTRSRLTEKIAMISEMPGLKTHIAYPTAVFEETLRFRGECLDLVPVGRVVRSAG